MAAYAQPESRHAHLDGAALAAGSASSASECRSAHIERRGSLLERHERARDARMQPFGERFAIDHTTIQIEQTGPDPAEATACQEACEPMGQPG